MPKKAVLLKSLARGRVRASFNKYNLFNLYKKGKMDFKTKTLYQQKFAAKQETRAYHGEHLTEGRFNTLFDPKLKSVAQLDTRNNTKETPYVLQTYAALEKRLEFALFRAMFASSIRQARQFILHGNVFVNGVKMRHPGYPLKAGDMFQVKRDKVLEALGAKKPSLEESLKIDKIQVEEWNKYVKDAKENPQKAWNNKIQRLKRTDTSPEEKQEFEEFLEQYRSDIKKSEKEELENCNGQFFLKELIRLHYNKLKSDEEHLSPLIQKEIQHLVCKDTTKTLIQKLMDCYNNLEKSGLIKWDTLMDKDSNLRDYSDKFYVLPESFKEKLSDNEKSLVRSAKQTLTGIINEYSLIVSSHYRNLINDIESGDIPYDSKWADRLEFHPELDFEKLKANERTEMKMIQLPWQKGYTYGRQDINKPYFTPWKPRQFLSPFAILPNHIEISFKTCSAIYLRDPIARPGQSEVISPFDSSIHERAYMFYSRKGR